MRLKAPSEVLRFSCQPWITASGAHGGLSQELWGRLDATGAAMGNERFGLVPSWLFGIPFPSNANNRSKERDPVAVTDFRLPHLLRRDVSFFLDACFDLDESGALLFGGELSRHCCCDGDD